MEPAKTPYWFPAKTYGWGWGPPSTWQGWVVLAAYVGLLALGFVLFPPPGDTAFFIGYLAIVTAMLLAVCWLKGEPPKWRWGKERK